MRGLVMTEADNIFTDIEEITTGFPFSDSACPMYTYNSVCVCVCVCVCVWACMYAIVSHFLC